MTFSEYMYAVIVHKTTIKYFLFKLEYFVCKACIIIWKGEPRQLYLPSIPYSQILINIPALISLSLQKAKKIHIIRLLSFTGYYQNGIELGDTTDTARPIHMIIHALQNSEQVIVCAVIVHQVNISYSNEVPSVKQI